MSHLIRRTLHASQKVLNLKKGGEKCKNLSMRERRGRKVIWLEWGHFKKEVRHEKKNRIDNFSFSCNIGLGV